MILFRKEDPEYGWLSNFSLHSIPIENRIFRTAEHLFQAAKFWDTNPEVVNKILECGTSAAAKKLGRSPNPDPNWNKGEGFEKKKVRIMMRVLALKAIHHPELARRLIDTGFDELVEFAPWGDRFWGVDKNLKGENWLGKCWMRLRAQLRGESK